MAKGKKKGFVNRIENKLSGFIREHIMKNLSVVVLITVIIGILGIIHYRKNATIVSIIVFMMTQVISAAIVILQLRLNAKNDFRANLSWNTYEILSKAYENVGQLDAFEFSSVSKIVDRIRNNPGVNFENMNVTKPENSYMREYRSVLGENISNIYSIVIPVKLKLSVYLKNHDLRKIEGVMTDLENDIKQMKKKYTETEEIWREISQAQYDLKDVEAIEEKKRELKSNKEAKNVKEKIDKLNEKIDKSKSVNSEINSGVKKSYKEMKSKYKEIAEFADNLADQGGSVYKFEEQLKETIRNHRQENKFYKN